MVVSLDAWLDAFFRDHLHSNVWSFVKVSGGHSISFCVSENVSDSLLFLKAGLPRSTDLDVHLKAALCPLTWAGCSE